ncbi:prolyl-tRNA synthetase, putative [Coccidioides posadasii C735 delta SOWgp]|uniref:proline--tRNA ligase n=1 Tax=Coccidioides posadasii (strain C735) TaxID=222929 RepID=C5P5H3_COCP7|nr:prolyl-tRNA synthetase, putative [Coccidioides posadasii C735 delta SOWgp]EER27963.1 prolyl-tRNA synthetase, putative [Coccidioides posadasii C735 delta SOWgp]|eukprot:XP_003070108.1 prolyl-tRNA synthetase, putative [Coccidioides posadasii C735 delta SOWgp]
MSGSMLFYPRFGVGHFRKWNPSQTWDFRLIRRRLHDRPRNLRSKIWVPIAPVPKNLAAQDSTALLVQAGFIRQAYAGIYHLLPLGLRVQKKLENLIDKHMESLGASKLFLSALSSQLLWKLSGRLHDDSEVFRFLDRKYAPFLLAPTHEEEITKLVGGLTNSYKELPLRVYQISRKYRDERRPRQGLLRAREFLMKDLYTFDYSTEEAMKSYNSVKEAYVRLFDELKLPYIVAAADSGNMGGNLNHEFHLENSKGEDIVVSCSKCNYKFNEELTDGHASKFASRRESSPPYSRPGPLGQSLAAAISTGVWTAVSKDRRTLIRAYYPKYLLNENTAEPVEREVNPHAVRSIALAHGVFLDLAIKNASGVWRARAENGIDTELQARDMETEAQDDDAEAQLQSKSMETELQHDSIEAESQGLNVLDIYDFRVRPYDRPPLNDLLDSKTAEKKKISFSSITKFPGTDHDLDFVRVQSGDRCSKCEDGVVTTHTTIEMGHTFLLGTRYSSPLQATVAIDPAKSVNADGAKESPKSVVPLQMGCYGIGVSRMIAAVADILADSRGLNWPRAMAPFSAIIVPGLAFQEDSKKIYDHIASYHNGSIDTILDDRERPLIRKLKDADLTGIPVICVVGKSWERHRNVEVQCRRLNNLRTDVSLDELPSFISSLLDKL